jgi:hypothetical protein
MGTDSIMIALDASLIKIPLQHRTALRIDQGAKSHHLRVLFGTITDHDTHHFVLSGEEAQIGNLEKIADQNDQGSPFRPSVSSLIVWCRSTRWCKISASKTLSTPAVPKNAFSRDVSPRAGFRSSYMAEYIPVRDRRVSDQCHRFGNDSILGLVSENEALHRAVRR